MSKLKLFSNERIKKILIYVVTDIIFVNMSIIFGISLWADGTLTGRQAISIPIEIWNWYLSINIFVSIIAIVVYAIFGMYNNLWKYASIDELLKIFICTTVLFIIIFLFDTFVFSSSNFLMYQKRLLFVAWMSNTILFSFSRFGYRAVKRIFIFLGHIVTSKSGCTQVMIIGAGFTGYGVIKEMLNSKIRDKYPAIVIDKDPNKNNTNILGVRVLSGFNKIRELAIKYRIDEIIIAIPTETQKELNKVLNECANTDCTLKIIPSIKSINDKEVNFKNKSRDVNIADLLFRDEVELDNNKIKKYLHDEVVLVTGGGGSIGSELCKQIVNFKPKTLIIFDIYENNAFYLLNELKREYDDLNAFIRIGSIQDLDRLTQICREFNPSVIFHAAAHKHVAIMEENPGEAIKNNIFGTLNLVKCADKFNVKNFVLLSTDKAVNPTNIMGASKRVSELIIQNMSVTSKTKFMAVRFGNVLGSNGSVIHVFKKQIERGGPVTVTDANVERYFMTISEACQLVLQAGSIGNSGNIFVLDMGKPIKINDLAINLIKLSGYKPNQDIKIKYTGLLPGEKLHEELILDEEKDTLKITYHKKIFITKPFEVNSSLFEKQLSELYDIVYNNFNIETIDEKIKSILSNYKLLYNKNVNKKENI